MLDALAVLVLAFDSQPEVVSSVRESCRERSSKPMLTGASSNEAEANQTYLFCSMHFIDNEIFGTERTLFDLPELFLQHSITISRPCRPCSRKRPCRTVENSSDEKFRYPALRPQSAHPERRRSRGSTPRTAGRMPPPPFLEPRSLPLARPRRRRGPPPP